MERLPAKRSILDILQDSEYALNVLKYCLFEMIFMERIFIANWLAQCNQRFNIPILPSEGNNGVNNNTNNFLLKIMKRNRFFKQAAPKNYRD